MKTIETSEEVYKGLADLIVGFDDTPNSVINRLLEESANKNIKPELGFYPSVERTFKKLLLRDKKAELVLYKKRRRVRGINLECIKTTREL